MIGQEESSDIMILCLRDRDFLDLMHNPQPHLLIRWDGKTFCLLAKLSNVHKRKNSSFYSNHFFTESQKKMGAKQGISVAKLYPMSHIGYKNARYFLK